MTDNEYAHLWEEVTGELVPEGFYSFVQALRAQADARPAGHFFKASRVHPWVQVEKECPNAVPLYTHPVEAATGPSIDEMAREFSAMSEDVMGEMLALLHKRIEAHSGRQMQASAPGLSDEDIFELWCSIPTQGSVDEDIVPFARALLTRASAATVGEASKVRHPISGQTLEELWLETGKLRSQIADLKAAQQQAEPGADERAAGLNDEALCELLYNCGLMTRHWTKEHNKFIYFAEELSRKEMLEGVRNLLAQTTTVAQSGQRAGVAEDAARYRWLRDNADYAVNNFWGDCSLVIEICDERIDAAIAAAPKPTGSGSAD